MKQKMLAKYFVLWMLATAGGWGCTVGIPDEAKDKQSVCGGEKKHTKTPINARECDAHQQKSASQESRHPKENVSKSTWVLLRAGSFQMGSAGGEAGKQADEVPSHTVRITRDYWMDKTEVTQKNFQDLMGYNPSHFVGCGGNCPVESVSWHEALAYSNARSRRDQLPTCFHCVGGGKDVWCELQKEYPTPYHCQGWRLPTEAEWEYAAKLGAIEDKSAKLDDMFWYGENSDHKTHPVGQKKANAVGLYDMFGNVWEWVYDGKINYPKDTVVDPVPSSFGETRVIRGGSWYNEPRFLRPSNRYSEEPNNRGYDLGFRLVRTDCP